MRIQAVLTAAASVAALSIAAPAMAQLPTTPVAAPAVDPPITDPSDPTAEDQVVPAEDPAGAIAGNASQPAGIPVSSPTPVEQAHLLKAGDPTVTSNSPVPDTPATRAAYGGPDSNGGRKTRPVGN